MAPGAASNLSFFENLVAGGCAGVAEILVMYPTDVLKTRYQLQRGQSTPLGQMVRTMVAKEGKGVFYRGIAAPICSEGPKRAVKFSTNEFYRKKFAKADGSLDFARYFAAGAAAGMTEAFVNCPFEVVKVRCIEPGSKELYKNAADAALKIVRQEGPAALYKGLEPQLWRNAWWNGPYFAITPHVKSQMGEGKVNSAIAGMVAGAFATCLNTPFDVVKSRMQAQKGTAATAHKYRWAYPSLVTIFREEGITALYKGLGMRLLRLGPGGGVMIVTFDVITQWMQQKKAH